MQTESRKRRPSARVLTVAGVALVALGAVGSAVGVPGGAIPLPLGVFVLLAAFVFALRRTDAIRALPSQDRVERRHAFSFRLLLLGLLMVPIALLISVVAGDFAAAGIFVPPVVIAVGLAVAIGLSGRFFVGAMVLGALLLVSASMAFQLELRHPESFSNFVPALWVTFGSATAFCAATAAVIQRRRRTMRPTTPLQRRLVAFGLVLLVAGSVASWFASGASRVTAAKAKGAPVVEMRDNEFLPNEFEVQRGGAARFYLVNKDSEPHTFTIDDLALDEYIGPLGERLVRFDVPSDAPPGMRLVCVVTGHEEMVGVIRAAADYSPE